MHARHQAGARPQNRDPDLHPVPRISVEHDIIRAARPGGTPDADRRWRCVWRVRARRAAISRAGMLRGRGRGGRGDRDPESPPLFDRSMVAAKGEVDASRGDRSGHRVLRRPHRRSEHLAASWAIMATPADDAPLAPALRSHRRDGRNRRRNPTTAFDVRVRQVRLRPPRLHARALPGVRISVQPAPGAEGPSARAGAAGTAGAEVRGRPNLTDPPDGMLARKRRAAQRPAGMLRPRLMYDCRSTSEPRCPECGRGL